MPKPKTKPGAGPKIAKGKTRVGYVLPEAMVVEIAEKAARERSWPAAVVERLIKAGLDSEAKKAAGRPAAAAATA